MISHYTQQFSESNITGNLNEQPLFALLLDL